jgi:hypothetical protein
MTTKNKYKLYLLIAIIFFILSVIILVFADGLRRWYSGGFFLIMGVVVISKAIYDYRKQNDTH